MREISLCMIVKNEEAVSAQCLNSVAHLCDEIIIVDTGSTDRTKEIAQEFTEKIYDFTWIDDFSAARNFSFQQATKDFILWLDADGVLLEEDQKKFSLLKEELDETIDAVSMFYHTAFDEFGKPTFLFRRNRLVKRKKNFKWFGLVHEYLAVSGVIHSSSIAITHRKSTKKANSSVSDRNLKIYENRRKKGESFSPRDLFYYANELKDHQNYQQAITYYTKFLETKKGWVEDRIRACIYMADCYRNRNMPEQEMEALTMSLLYDIPRPEVCCRMGDIYKKKAQFKKAIFWYEVAVTVEIENDSGFNIIGFSTWYPYLQLCVCYWKINDIDKAISCNNKAKEYRPNDETIKANETFFNVYLNKKNGGHRFS